MNIFMDLVVHIYFKTLDKNATKVNESQSRTKFHEA